MSKLSISTFINNVVIDADTLFSHYTLVYRVLSKDIQSITPGHLYITEEQYCILAPYGDYTLSLQDAYYINMTNKNIMPSPANGIISCLILEHLKIRAIGVIGNNINILHYVSKQCTTDDIIILLNHFIKCGIRDPITSENIIMQTKVSRFDKLIHIDVSFKRISNCSFLQLETMIHNTMYWLNGKFYDINDIKDMFAFDEAFDISQYCTNAFTQITKIKICNKECTYILQLGEFKCGLAKLKRLLDYDKFTNICDCGQQIQPSWSYCAYCSKRIIDKV